MRKYHVFFKLTVIMAVFLGVWGCFLEVDRPEGDRTCSSGDCCDDLGFLRSAEFICREEPQEEYRCTQENTCGSGVERKWVMTHCTGIYPECNGSKVDQWKAANPCETSWCEGGQCLCRNECCPQFHACDPQQFQCNKIGLNWAAGFGSTLADAATAVAAKKDDAFAATGVFRDTLSLGTAYVFTASPVDKTDIFLAKYEPSGMFEWAIQIGGTDDDQANALAWASDETIVLGGRFGGSVEFQAPTNIQLTANGQDAFLARFNPTNNNFDWAIQTQGVEHQEIIDLALLNDNTVITTGTYTSEIIFQTTPVEVKLTAAPNNQDMFIARYAADGKLDWALRAGSINANESITPSAVAVTADTILVTGDFKGTIRFYKDLQETGFMSISSANTDIFFAKYKADGTLVKVSRAGGPNIDTGTGVAGLPNGDFIVCGNIDGLVDFPSEPNPMTIGTTSAGNRYFLTRLDLNLNTQWVQSGDEQAYCTAQAVDVHPDNDTVIKLTGGFASTVNFGAGQDTRTTLSSWGTSDVFVARYDTTGRFLWVSQAGGNLVASPAGISTLKDGTSYVTGNFEGTWDFDDIGISAKGGQDVFIFRSR